MVEGPDKVFAVIVWNDAHGNSSNDVSEIDLKHAPIRYQTYGWVLKSDEVGVTIAAEWSASDFTWRSTTFIPRGMVLEERPLSLVRKSRREKKHAADPGHSPSG